MLFAEILSIKIKNEDITGIKVKNIQYWISQFADDTSMILDWSKNHLKQQKTKIDDYYRLSDLEINQEKTEIVWVGS